MTTAKEILEMIESVSPDDTDKLDEIDSHVFFFVDLFRKEYDTHCPNCSFDSGVPEYTRSRDALKSIRPDVWMIRITQNLRYLCSLANRNVIVGMSRYEVRSPALPTEELAELHAIIQAIQHERSE